MMLKNIVNFHTYPIDDLQGFAMDCRETLDKTGSLLLPNFIVESSVLKLKQEALEHAGLAFYCEQTHTAYLSAPDPEFDPDHSRNRQVVSSKGCITDDQIPQNSLLRSLYYDEGFQKFLCVVLQEQALYNYADPLSSINVHYYKEGQELGWHFDNSAFAVTLMIQPPQAGGCFEYIPKFRDVDQGDMNFDGVDKALNGQVESKRLDIDAGTLALFRGKNSLHRVTPVVGDSNRIQVVLAYNTQPSVALSEQARLTFYGRVN